MGARIFKGCIWMDGLMDGWIYRILIKPIHKHTSFFRGYLGYSAIDIARKLPPEGHLISVGAWPGGV